MDAAQRNRREFPETAKMVDEFRRVFGPVKLKWAIEDGKSIGRIPDDVRRNHDGSGEAGGQLQDENPVRLEGVRAVHGEQLRSDSA